MKIINRIEFKKKYLLKYPMKFSVFHQLVYLRMERKYSIIYKHNKLDEIIIKQKNYYKAYQNMCEDSDEEGINEGLVILEEFVMDGYKIHHKFSYNKVLPK